MRETFDFEVGDKVFFHHDHMFGKERYRNIPLTIIEFDDDEMNSATIATMSYTKGDHVGTIGGFIDRLIRCRDANASYYDNLDNEKALEILGRKEVEVSRVQML